MEYNQLFQELQKIETISNEEKEVIKSHTSVMAVKKRQTLIQKTQLCDKLFFVNKGLIRTFCICNNDIEFSRRIAWENGFITNMDSFRKNGADNNETIECIENAEIIVCTKNQLDYILHTSQNLKNIYQKILEKYMAINIRRYQHLAQSTPLDRLIYFNAHFPALKNRINDTILASFLSISRKTLTRTKKELLNF